MYDSWRRMELIRKAGAHVRRRGFQASVRLVANASSSQIKTAIEELGSHADYRQVLQSTYAPTSLKRAFSDLLFMSGDIVGSDGARQQLRHEQVGDVLRFGGLGAFLTLNVADVRSPLVVLLHSGPPRGCNANKCRGGLRLSYSHPFISYI